MKTDYLDVVQFHASPSKQTLEEHGALDALLELREAGKVRFVGMSGTLPHLIDHIAMGVFDVFQIPYSAVEREHEAAMLARAPASSFAAVPQRERQPKGNRPDCNGSAGAGHDSMTCSMA
jgi:aryl-alcohol dehydrogenase-like predicted oxidoreductase